jgi:hypothetical protein
MTARMAVKRVNAFQPRIFGGRVIAGLSVSRRLASSLGTLHSEKQIRYCDDDTSEREPDCRKL